MTVAYAYNHTAKKFLNKEVDFTGLKAMLVNGYVFDPTHVSISSVSPSEVSGNGWDAGGEPLTGVVANVITTNDARLDANNLNVTATPGAIGPATGVVIYDDISAGDDVLIFYDFETEITASVGTPFSLIWASSGLLNYIYA